MDSLNLIKFLLVLICFTLPARWFVFPLPAALPPLRPERRVANLSRRAAVHIILWSIADHLYSS
jgi:hypothetical protein